MIGGLALSLGVTGGVTWVLVSAFDPSGPTFQDFIDVFGEFGFPVFVIGFIGSFVIGSSMKAITPSKEKKE